MTAVLTTEGSNNSYRLQPNNGPPFDVHEQDISGLASMIQPLPNVRYVGLGTSTPTTDQNGSQGAPYGLLVDGLLNTPAMGTLYATYGDYSTEGNITVDHSLQLLGLADAASNSIAVAALFVLAGVVLTVDNVAVIGTCNVANTGVLVATGCQFSSGITGNGVLNLRQCVCNTPLAGSALDAQDSTIATPTVSLSGTTCRLTNCQLFSSPVVTFTGAAGTLYLDFATYERWVANGCGIVNGRISLVASSDCVYFGPTSAGLDCAPALSALMAAEAAGLRRTIQFLPSPVPYTIGTPALATVAVRIEAKSPNLRMCPGVKIRVNMTDSGSTPYPAAFGTVTSGAVSLSTTLATRALEGETTINVVDATGAVIGMLLTLAESLYKITHIAANVLSLDIPITQSQPATTPVTNIPSYGDGQLIDGNGCEISGTGSRFFSFPASTNITVRGFKLTDQFGTPNHLGSYDISTRFSSFQNIDTAPGVTTRLQLERNYRSTISHCNLTQLVPSTLLLDSCQYCEVDGNNVQSITVNCLQIARAVGNTVSNNTVQSMVLADPADVGTLTSTSFLNNIWQNLAIKKTTYQTVVSGGTNQAAIGSSAVGSLFAQEDIRIDNVVANRNLLVATGGVAADFPSLYSQTGSNAAKTTLTISNCLCTDVQLINAQGTDYVYCDCYDTVVTAPNTTIGGTGGTVSYATAGAANRLNLHRCRIAQSAGGLGVVQSGAGSLELNLFDSFVANAYTPAGPGIIAYRTYGDSSVASPHSSQAGQGVFVGTAAAPVVVPFFAIKADSSVCITPGSSTGAAFGWWVTIQAGVSFTFTSTLGDNNDYRFRVI